MSIKKSNLAWSETMTLCSIIDSIPGEIKGIEIGTLKGGSAIDMLENITRLKKLICIDPFKPYDDIDFPEYKIQEYWDKMYESVIDSFKRYGDRVELIKEYSADIAGSFKNGEYDFIWIDGDHSYEAVRKDLTLYEPKLKKDGYIIGHDYGNGLRRVEQAVDEYVAENKRIMFPVKDFIYSWKV